MREEAKSFIIGGIIAVIVIIVLIVLSVSGVIFRNKIDYAVQKADDSTNYDTIKQVEDTARAMIVQYTADKLTFETYNGSDSAEKQSWADQAKIRANTTAAQFNEYILKNSFVFKDNIPEDLKHELEYLK